MYCSYYLNNFSIHLDTEFFFNPNIITNRKVKMRSLVLIICIDNWLIAENTEEELLI